MCIINRKLLEDGDEQKNVGRDEVILTPTFEAESPFNTFSFDLSENVDSQMALDILWYFSKFEFSRMSRVWVYNQFRWEHGAITNKGTDGVTVSTETGDELTVPTKLFAQETFEPFEGIQ